MQSAVAITL